MATRLEDGRYQSRKRMPDGTRKAGYGATPEEADADLAAKIALTLSPEPTEGLTLSEFAMSHWWPTVETTCGRNTQRKYIADWQAWIKPALGHIPLRDVGYAEIQKLLTDMGAKGKSPNTRKNVKALLSTILNLAERLDMVKRNEARHTKAAGRREIKSRRRKRSVPPATARRILTETEGPLAAAVFLAAVLGLREGEVSALSWDRLDRQGGLLLVDRQHIEVYEEKIGRGTRKREKRKVNLQTTPTKTGEERTIYLPPPLVEWLDKAGNLDSEWIVSDKGEPLSPTAIYKRWMRVRESFGLKEFTFHDLRHCAAGAMHASDTDLFTIRETLGHSSLDMTQGYTHVQAAAQRDALSRVWRKVFPVETAVDAS